MDAPFTPFMTCAPFSVMAAAPTEIKAPDRIVSEGSEIGVEPAGAKSALVKAACKTLAAAFRYGGDALEYVLKWVDDDAAEAVAKYSDEIADQLDYISTISDLTVNMVKEYMYNFLVNNLGLSGGIAYQIADAIATTINWLIF